MSVILCLYTLLASLKQIRQKHFVSESGHLNSHIFHMTVILTFEHATHQLIVVSYLNIKKIPLLITKLRFDLCPLE